MEYLKSSQFYIEENYSEIAPKFVDPFLFLQIVDTPAILTSERLCLSKVPFL